MGLIQPEILMEIVDDHVRINDTAFLSILEKIGERKFVIISINGRFHTENALSPDSNFLYLLSSGSESWIDGIHIGQGLKWKRGADLPNDAILVWPNPIIKKDKDGEEIAIILMDSHGSFSGIENSNGNTNSPILAMSALISSIFVHDFEDQISKEQVHPFVNFLDQALKAKNATDEDISAIDVLSQRKNLEQTSENGVKDFPFLSNDCGKRFCREELIGMEPDINQSHGALMSLLCFQKNLRGNCKTVQGVTVSGVEFIPTFTQIVDIFNTNRLKDVVSFYNTVAKVHNDSKKGEIISSFGTTISDILKDNIQGRPADTLKKEFHSALLDVIDDLHRHLMGSERHRSEFVRELEEELNWEFQKRLTE